MTAIHVDVTGDYAAIAKRTGADRLPVLHSTADWTVAAMRGGMRSGATSLMLIVPVHTADGPAVLMAESSLQCWMMASGALRGAFTDEVDQPGWAVPSQAARDVIVPRYIEAIRRAIPGATPEQAAEAAAMMLDSLGSDRP